MSEQNDIRVSAVIPAYNAAACIGRAIESVLNQSLPVYEIVVVDDGSSDKTSEIVEQFGDKVILIRQDNAGVSVARNTGIKAASGDWIAFLDDDDIWFDEKNASQMAVIENNPELRWCASNYYRGYEDRRSAVGNQSRICKGLAGKDYFDNFFIASVNQGCQAQTQTMMIRKDVFDELGGFEPGRIRSQDLDVWWRIGHRYPKIGYVAEPLAMMYLDEHVDTLTARRVNEKHGVGVRELVARHLELADKAGTGREFRPFAAAELKRRLRSMLFNGFGEDARVTLRDFGFLFSWYVRWGGRLLATFPKATSAGMRSISWFKHAAGLNRKVTR
ncbi:MAG: glycosyltransferase family 2 protein, partial [Planctomycetes bacterium]|nr:glycosyltransferase family 2 protein [Planctomycetota bacterium]